MQIVIKVIGVLFLFLCGTFLGNYFAKKLCTNTLVLKDIIAVLTHLENNIIFKKDNVFKAINEIKTSCVLDAFVITQSIETQQDIIAMLEKNKQSFSDKQYQMLTSAFSRLGNSITNQESKNLSYYINYFNQEKLNAQQYEDKNAKLYRSLGMYAGIALAIFIV